MSFISVFSAHGQAAVPLSAAWHSASLQLPAQGKAKRTLIFLVSRSVGKQGSPGTQGDSIRGLTGLYIVSCRDGCISENSLLTCIKALVTGTNTQ